MRRENTNAIVFIIQIVSPSKVGRWMPRKSWLSIPNTILSVAQILPEEFKTVDNIEYVDFSNWFRFRTLILLVNYLKTKMYLIYERERK